MERYALFATADIKVRFATSNTILGNFKKRYNVRPTQNMPVIVQQGDERKIEFKTWGLVPKNARDQNGVFRYKTYTIAEEDVFKKNSTEQLVRTQRCIVPVNGFYLWSKDTPYFVYLPDYAPFGLAGIYSSWTATDGTEQGTFAVLNVESGESLARVSDRAPVILTQADESAWLDPARSDMTTVYNITKPYTGDDLIIDRVSTEVNGRRIDMPNLIKLLA